MAGAPQAGGQEVTPNINQAAAQGIMGAGMGTAQGMAFDPGTLAQTDLSQYQNPYTQQVIDTTMADLERQRQIQANQTGAQASAARAFGGSRHGVAESLTNEAFMRQGAQTAAGLRQAGFNQAQNMAQQDIQNRMMGQQARTGAAGQLANIAQTGYGMGRQATQDLMSTGTAQQALQQQLIDAAKQQFAGYTGAPAASIGYVTQALGATPTPQTQTTSKQPGLFDYLTLFMA